MSKALSLRWPVIVVGAMVLALAAACGAEPEIVEVEKEVVVEREVVKEVPVEVVVQKEVIKEVPVDRVMVKEVPVEKVVKEVVEVEREVVKEVPVEVIVKEKVVEIVEVEKPVVVEREVVREVEVEKIVVATPEAMMMDFKPSGEVVIAVGIEPVSMDAWRGFGETGSPGFKNVVESLVHLDLATSVISPFLATSWERINPTTMQFKLREGVTFHDGSPFNAAAAAASINHTFDPDNAFDLLDFIGGMSAEAVGEYTLNVWTEEPDPLLLQKMDFVSISSAKQLAEDPDSYHTNLIGTGPYKFARWDKGVGLTYEANSDWWGIGNPAEAGGAISFQTVTYKVLSEDQVRTAGVLADEYDIAQYVTAEQCAAAEANSGSHCQAAASVETILIRMDTNGPMLGDIRVRKAIQAAIDKELLVETILGGAATVTGQIINPTALGNNPNLSPYPYDPDFAKFLVAQAKADGVPVDMEITLGARQALFAGIDELIQAVADMLRDVGFSVKTQFFDPEGFGVMVTLNYKDVPADRNAVVIHMHGNEILDFAYSYGLYYHCDGVVSVYCNPEADKVHAEALPLSGDARDQKLQQLNKIIHDDVAIGYVAHVDLAYAVSDNLNWRIQLDHRLIAKNMSRR